MTMDSILLTLLDEVSADPRSLNAQRRVNAWLVEKTRCRNSAFAMVVDNYGHCCVQVCGRDDLATPLNAGNAQEWSEIFEGRSELSYRDLPKKMQRLILRIFDVHQGTDIPVTAHVLRDSSADSFLGVLFILHSEKSSRSSVASNFLKLSSAGSSKECIKVAGSLMRMSAALEKQVARTKLNGFILTLLRNVFANLENMAQLVHSICKDAKKLIPSQECALYLIDQESSELVAEVVEKDEKNEEYLKELRFPITEGVVGQVAASGKMINLCSSDGVGNCNAAHESKSSCSSAEQDVDTAEMVEHRLKTTDFRNMLCFPVKDQKNVIAVIQLLNKIDTDCYTAYDEQLAELLSSYCAISISHCLLFKRLQEANRRTHLASELMMYHTQKIAEEDVLRLSLCPIPRPAHLNPAFTSFFYSPREMALQDTHMACLSMFVDLGFVNAFRIKRRKMSRFLLSVEKAYRDVPYHNWYHAFTVAHFCYLILRNIPAVRKQLSDIDCLCLLVACLCHDIDHRGTTNSFQVQSKTALAQLYSSEGSVLECHHFAQTMCILNIEECNIFADLHPNVYQMILDKIRDIILATDLAQHLRIRAEIVQMAKSGFQKDNERHVFLLHSALMTACDLADQVKPWTKSKMAAAQVYKEFFSQGDLEKAMGNRPVEAMDRDKANIMNLQLDFLDTIALPLFKILYQMFPQFKPVYESACFNRFCYETMQKLLMKSKETTMSQYDISVLSDSTVEKQVLEIAESMGQTCYQYEPNKRFSM
uniref:Phosphodiesterase n=1 Tax=Trichuris muris TaxID=70415 RepID=A0A5S6Q3D5_TRIMR